MNYPIVPEKYVRTNESLIGLGALVLSALSDNQKTIDSVFKEIAEGDTIHSRIHGSISFESVVMAVNFLYLIDAISMTSNGLLVHANNRT